MQRQPFEGRFYETYYFANVVRNVLHDQISYLRTLDGFYGNDEHLEYVKPFPRWSAFHSFIAFTISELVSDQLDKLQLDRRKAELTRFATYPRALEDLNPTSLPLNDALRYYDIEHPSFEAWLTERGKTFLDAHEDDAFDYYNDLRLEGPFDALLNKAVPEAFFVLFQNRGLLLLFNDMMAAGVADTDTDSLPDEYRMYFESPGILRRVTTPSWVKRAVFYRDRGLCVLCQRDLSGTMIISNLAHYDHMVPLARGGLNDVTNIQLLCQDCNLRKHDADGTTSNIYEAWYPLSTHDDDEG